jgi:hypothetical protein
MLFHFQAGTTSDDALTTITSVVDAMANAQWDGTSWDQMEFAVGGSDIFAPVGWAAVTADTGFNPTGDSPPSNYVNFLGRSPTTGVRARWFLFENPLAGDNQMRYTRGEKTQVDDVVDALVTAALDNLGAIDGTGITIKLYANLGQNDHLTKRARRS